MPPVALFYRDLNLCWWAAQPGCPLTAGGNILLACSPCGPQVRGGRLTKPLWLSIWAPLPQLAYGRKAVCSFLTRELIWSCLSAFPAEHPASTIFVLIELFLSPAGSCRVRLGSRSWLSTQIPIDHTSWSLYKVSLESEDSDLHSP